MADEFLDARCTDENGDLCLRRWNGTWYRYDQGVYRPVSNEDLDAELVAFLKAHPLHRDLCTNNFLRDVRANLVDRDRCAVPSRVRIPCWLNADFASAAGWMPMANGVFHLRNLAGVVAGQDFPEADLQREPSPQLFTTCGLSYQFNPEAAAPRFEQFLREIQPDQQARDVIQMLMGLLLVPDCSFDVAFIFVGVGDNGKTVLLEIITALVGQANVCSVPLAYLGNRFSTWPLTRALVNIVGDMPTDDGLLSHRQTEGIFKDVCSGALLRCERKGVDEYYAHVTARNLFATNTLPYFCDRSNGVWRRLRVIPFPVTIPSERKEPALAERIIATELPGVLNYALKGLARLSTMTYFPEVAAGYQEKEEHRRNTDPVRLFLESHYTSQGQPESSVVGKEELYTAWDRWTRRNGYHAGSLAEFCKGVKRILPQVGELRQRSQGGRTQYWTCIAKVSDL